MKLATTFLAILAAVLYVTAFTGCASNEKSPDDTLGAMAGRPGQF